MQLAIFKYQEENTNAVNDFTTVEIDGEPWFIAKDVCELLGISNSRDAVSGLDDDEKLVSVIPTRAGNRSATLINEGNDILIYTN